MHADAVRRFLARFLRRRNSRPAARRLRLESLETRQHLAADFAAIAGYVFDDPNNDGVFETQTERGLPGVAVRLTGTNDLGQAVNLTQLTRADDPATLSDETGLYQFSNLREGDYTVTQVPPPPAGFVQDPGANTASIRITAAQASGVAGTAVDSFSGAPQTVVASMGTVTEQGSSRLAAVLGGERDLWVRLDSATGSVSFSSNDSEPNVLSLDPSSSASGTYRATWDGPDGDADTLDPTGLGGVDLTEAGAMTALRLTIGVDKPNASAKLRVYSDAAHASEATVSIPFTSGVAFNELLFRFDSPAWQAIAGTGADFTNVGAIELEIQSPVSAMDGQVDLLAALGPTVVQQNFANLLSIPDLNLIKTTNGDDANAAPGPLVAVGATVTFGYAVTNTGNVPLHDLELTDDNGTPTNPADDLVPAAVTSAGFNAGDANRNRLLDVGETWRFTATRVATPGQYVNLATATALDPLDQPAADDDPSHHFGAAPAIAIQKATNGDDADLPTGPVVSVGDLVTWSYVVTNAGNVELHDVAVVDDNGTPADPGDDFTVVSGVTLAPGESRTFTETGVAIADQYGNLAAVTGVDPLGTLVAADDPSHYFGADPAIELKKATNGDDADTPTGPLVPVGGAVTWTYVVTNAGNVPLSDVEIVDDAGTPADPADDVTVGTGQTLSPGESRTFSLVGTAVAGQYANNAVVTGVSPQGVQVADNDPSHYFGFAPAIDLKKFTNGIDADTSPGPSIPVGSPVTWTYRVTNTGNVPLNDVRLVDDNGTPGNTADDISIVTGVTLGPGASQTFSHNSIAVAGQYGNVATVTGRGPAETVSDTDPSHYFGAAPGLQLKKATNGIDADTAPGPTLVAGSPVTWTYVVTNTGNVPLNDVRIVDDNGTPASASDDAVVASGVALAIGESRSFTLTGVVQTGPYRNVATASGRDAVSTVVSSSDPSHYFGEPPIRPQLNPDIQLVKSTNGQDANTATGPLVAVGSTVTWTYVVTNLGDEVLTNVRIVDDMGTPANSADDVVVAQGVTLGLSQSQTFTLTGVAQAGQYTNVATVTASGDVQTVTDSDPSNYFGVLAGVDIEKAVNGVDADTAAAGPTVRVGELVTFTYVVRNTGNVALGSVVVTDDRGVTVQFVGGDTDGDGRLDTTETWTYQATATATSGQYQNTGSVDANPVQADGTDIAGLANVLDADLAHYFGQTAYSKRRFLSA